MATAGAAGEGRSCTSGRVEMTAAARSGTGMGTSNAVLKMAASVWQLAYW